MLQAKNKNGRVITLASMKRDVIEKLRKEGEKYYCPVCEQPVIMKAGWKITAHFAHQTESNCPSREGGEGIYHEQGKLLLYHWLKKYKMDVTLEAYLPEIQQRPDILISLHNKKIAIEYQCARISAEEVRKRNAGYKTAGIFPIWILGANHFKRYSANTFRLDQFTHQFIHQHTPETPFVLYYFDPHTSDVAIVHDIFITKTFTAIGKIDITKIYELKFTDLFQLDYFSQKDLFNLWVKEKRQFRLRPAKKIYGNELTWRKWLYYKGFHPENLPSLIHLPIKTQHRMKTPIWNWQSKVILEIIQPVSVGEIFHIDSCKHNFRNQILDASLFPLISVTEHPIRQYLHLLEQLNYIRKVSSTTYKKIEQVKAYKNVEDAMQGDNLLLAQLIFQNSDKIRA
ncbi:competence protein CoiA [Oceanobacillus damuensis]|uniref:competence protein CoiA n=1 Tax=Oceanobacillus damuensis TaxID=937928 RepID=UPI000830A982|nr:competence protein CoiA family protein [Oceanobacillus damuensis]